MLLGAVLAAGNVLSRHWTAVSGVTGSPAAGVMMPEAGAAGPMQQVVVALGPPLYLALAVWLSYMGFEPYLRRRWPHLLITSTRLLDGRWRDPLVGRSLLVGAAGAIATCVGVFVSIGIVRLAGWGTVVPTFPLGTLDGVRPFAGYLARVGSVYEVVALVYIGVMLAARFLFRSTPAAWTGLTAMCLVMFAAWCRVFLGPYPALVALASVVLTATSVLVLWRGGLLALGVWAFAQVVLRDTPWTPALTQWYAWPAWLSAALMAGLLVWGFRNVLGRQSAFAAES